MREMVLAPGVGGSDAVWSMDRFGSLLVSLRPLLFLLSSPALIGPHVTSANRLVSGWQTSEGRRDADGFRHFVRFIFTDFLCVQDWNV